MTPATHSALRVDVMARARALANVSTNHWTAGQIAADLGILQSTLVSMFYRAGEPSLKALIMAKRLRAIEAAWIRGEDRERIARISGLNGSQAVVRFVHDRTGKTPRELWGSRVIARSRR